MNAATETTPATVTRHVGMKNKPATIADVLADTYGVSHLSAEPLYVGWAADRALDLGLPVKAAKVEIRKINASRARLGRIPFSPAYGTRLF